MTASAIYNFNAIPSPDADTYRRVPQQVAENEAEFRRSIERWCAQAVQVLTGNPLGPSGITITGTSNRITVTGSYVIDIASSYVGQSTIITLGTITTGVWNASVIGTAFTEAKLKTLTGTASRITIGGTATDPTVDIHASYVGQASITTLGTIATGVWDATAIAWAKVNKAGSSLADLTTRSAGDLSSGNLAYARLPSGGGTWANGGTLSITGGITTVAGLTSTDDVLIGNDMYYAAKDTGGAAGGVVWVENNDALHIGDIDNRFAGPAIWSAGAPVFKFTNVAAIPLTNYDLGTSLIPFDNLFLNVNAKIMVAGGGFYVKEGSNATMGVATLSGGTVTVNTTKVTANSRIFLTNQANGGTVGALYISARTASTSFTITSTNGADTSTVAWIIVEPA